VALNVHTTWEGNPRIEFVEHTPSRPITSSEQPVASNTSRVDIDLIRPGIEK